MRVNNPPSKQAFGTGLGFDFSELIGQIAPAAVQLYGNKQAIDMQKAQAAQQLKMQQATQQAAQMASGQYGQYPQTAYPSYGSRGSMGGLPSWAVPVGIGAAGLLLVLAMKR